MTRAGVTPITLLGGASKSFPTLQPISATATSEASVPCVVRIVCPLRARTFHAWLPHGDRPREVGFGASDVVLQSNSVVRVWRWCHIQQKE